VNLKIYIVPAVCGFFWQVFGKRYLKSPTTNSVVKFISSINEHKRIKKIAKATTDRGKLFMTEEWKNSLNREI
jgi:hypothetical protein